MTEAYKLTVINLSTQEKLSFLIVISNKKKRNEMKKYKVQYAQKFNFILKKSSLFFIYYLLNLSFRKSL